MEIKKIIFLSLILMFLIPIAFAHETDTPHIELPSFIQEAQQQTKIRAQSLTYLAAFIGGAVMLFAPCSLVLLPGYFAMTFKEKRGLTFSTFVFFLGFALIFSLMGVGASFIGAWININQPILTRFVGVLLILFGMLSLLGKALPLPKVTKNPGSSFLEIFTFGVVYAFGYAGCTGPILLAILTLAAILSPVNAVIMMSIYALGLALPLLILSYFFDRFNLFENKLLKRVFEFNLFKNKFVIGISNLIGGLLFIIIGVVFVVYRNIGVLTPSYTGISRSIYEFNYEIQNMIISLNIPFANFIFVFIFIGIIVFVTKGFWIKLFSKR